MNSGSWETVMSDAGDAFDAHYALWTDERKDVASTKKEWARISQLAEISHREYRILDAPCGQARFADPITSAGHEYVGVDRSPFMIEHAKAKSSAQVVLITRDIEDCTFDMEFDLAINWFTSFGYDSDQSSKRCLERLYSALKPGGRLVMEIMNGQWLLNNLSATEKIVQTFDMTYGTVRDVNYVTADGIWHIMDRTYDYSGSQSHSSFAMRVLTADALTNWLHDAGFQSVDIFGSDERPLTNSDPRMHVVAVR
ncbi:class I SAM-dependent methyltransferase [Nocardioides bruguierae]|uniref:Methyltransferase domain-containing protein n=1 Tax=Nocardioides bruguierae TaxID=2945102 RepID=A0A9X2DDL6_9ACTN|nr:class I SAM-dependent methyltransferase [Nocardioides bruguierae]MCM0622529.1 methyltransferase domain-containing protein [Nocardioides bruguierae]